MFPFWCIDCCPCCLDIDQIYLTVGGYQYKTLIGYIKCDYILYSRDPDNHRMSYEDYEALFFENNPDFCAEYYGPDFGFNPHYDDFFGGYYDANCNDLPGAKFNHYVYFTYTFKFKNGLIKRINLYNQIYNIDANLFVKVISIDQVPEIVLSQL